MTRPMTLALLACLLLAPKPAAAGWWIFGQTANEVRLNYLTINGASTDELGPKVTVYKSALKDGQVAVKGRASVRKGKVGLVQVTTDGGETWSKANLSAAGDFEHSFAVETGKSYKVRVKVTDTSGKTNDVDATAKEVTVSDRDARAEIKAALDGMVAAYQAKDPVKFMAFVADDFASDRVVLDRAVRKDFSAFNSITLSYTINNITAGDGGLVSVAISYRRMVTSSKSGQNFTDSGSTLFVFRAAEARPQVYSMKNPLIFGLSDASEVATGTTPGNTAPVTAVDNTGNVTQVPPSSQNDTGSEPTPIAAANATIPAANGFKFADASAVGNPPCPNGADVAYSPAGPGSLVICGGRRYKALGTINVDNTTSVPDQSTYNSAAAPTNVALAVNGGYALYTGGKYVVLAVTAINAPANITIRYKYQPNGTPNF